MEEGKKHADRQRVVNQVVVDTMVVALGLFILVCISNIKKPLLLHM